MITSRFHSNANTSSNNSLRQSFAWTAAGNVFYAASQWIVLVLLARLGSPQVVGEFALATAISSPIFALSSLKLRSVQAADVLSDFPFNTYLSVRIITSLSAIVLVVAIAIFGGFSASLAWVISLVGLSKAIESGSDILHGLQQRYERMETVSKSLGIKGLLSVGSFSLAYILSDSLAGGILGLVFAWGATLTFFDIPQGRLQISNASAGSQNIRPSRDWDDVFRVACLAAPLGATVAIGSLAANVPRYFAGGMLSTQDLGVFAAISYIMVAGTLLISSISQAATPRLSLLFRTGKVDNHLQLVLQLLALGAAIGLAGIVIVALIGDDVLRIVYGVEYARYQSLFLLIMINAAVSYSYVFLGTALTSMRKFTVQLPVHVAGLAILTLACLISIPRFGLIGVPLAMITANLAQAGAYVAIFLRISHGTATSSDKEVHQE